MGGSRGYNGTPGEGNEKGREGNWDCRNISKKD